MQDSCQLPSVAVLRFMSSEPPEELAKPGSLLASTALISGLPRWQASELHFSGVSVLLVWQL